MNTTDKRLLFEYVKLHQPIWQITQFHGQGRRGMYRFWAYDLEDGISVMRYDGYDWQSDGTASYEFVQKIVDRHRAGKILDDLATGITRTVPDTVWSC